MRKRLVSLMVLLIGVMTLSLYQPNAPVSAGEENDDIEMDLRYDNFFNVNCSVSISSGNATVRSKVDGKQSVISTSITVYLEYYSNDSWQTYTSWSHNGGQSQDNTDNTNVSHGLYRVRMLVTASLTGGGSDSFEVQGNTVLFWL